MNTLRFETIKIDRILGIRRGDGFELNDLSPGINLVHGPNGSGKTTMARALQEILWPGHAGLERPTLAADVVLDDGRRHVEIDAGYVTITPADLSALGPPDTRARYRLALHELLSEDDRRFADIVVKETQGGIDLAAAAKDAAILDKGGAGSREAQAVRAQRDTLREAQQRQAAIQQDAEKRDGLRVQREQAQAAQGRVAILERALDHHAAAAECARLETRLAVLPPVLAKLRGDERQRWDEIDQSIEAIEQTLRDTRRQIQEREREIAETKLPDGAINAQPLRILYAARQSVRERETAIETLRGEVTRLAVTEEQARRRLGAALTPEQRDGLQTVPIEPLDDFARRVDRLRAAEAVLNERRRWLEPCDVAAAEIPDASRLQRGIAALTDWLSAPSVARSSRRNRGAWIGVAAATVLGGLGVLLAVLVDWAWGIVLLPALALWGIAWIDAHQDPAGSPAAPDARAVHRQSYEATGLPLPLTWEPVAVRERLSGLLDQEAKRTIEAERTAKRRELTADQERVDAQRKQMEAERQAIAAQLGVDLCIEGEWLPRFIEMLGEWQQSWLALTTAQTDRDRLDHERRDLLRQLADGLSPYGYAAPSNAAVAGDCLDDLKARSECYLRAMGRRDDLQRRIRDEIEPDRDRLIARRTTLVAAIGLHAGQETMLDAWLARLPERDGLVERLAEQRILRDNAAAALDGHAEMMALDRAELESRLTAATGLAADLESLIQQLTRIETAIEQAKTGYDLTDALAAHADAVTALEAVREQHLHAAAGAALYEWLRVTAIERARPAVFLRAKRYFSLFTHHCLELAFDDAADPPRFTARRGREAPRPVEQLSSGERVQLLIAVRLAFIEQNESVRLPLILDEALGTSDDVRAGAIIAAVKQIAASGRQIFYFTAQHDEVGKWRAQLDSTTAHQVFDLAAIRQMAGYPADPLPIMPVARVPVPPPGDDDYAAYGLRLGVPPLDPTGDDIDRLHLWHVLDDAATLYRLLEHDITTWGQLRSLIEQGGGDLIDGLQERFRRAERIVRLIEIAFETWRIGRGKPVDRAVLADSGCVSDRFIDRVAALCADVKGDARVLLERLNEGAVERWRQATTESLAAYLRDEGYLDDRSPYAIEDLRTHVLAAAASDLRDGLLTFDRLDGLPS